MSILPKVKVSDVPAKEAKAFKATGTVSEVKTRDIANGYVQVEVLLKYLTDSGSQSDFTARFNVRPEWFTPEYSEKAKSGQLSDSEKIQYDINMSGLTRGLFASAGLEDMDFDLLKGATVGFKTKTRKDDPSRLDISYFFKPRN